MLLVGLDTDAERKAMVLDWCRRGLITTEDAELLISSMLLEDA